MPDEPSFTDEQFMSAAVKQKVLRAWKRFLKGGCKRSQFTEDLYKHLTLHCSFIAHFSRQGFYSFYFGQITPSLFRFFDQFDPQKPGISAELGATYWLSKHITGSDLSHAMRKASGPYLQSLRQTFAETRRQTDIAAATGILATYGLAVVPASPSSVNNDVKSHAAPRTPLPSLQQDLFFLTPPNAETNNATR